MEYVFNGNIFGNVNSNYYYLKPETKLKHGIRQWKVTNNDDLLYIVEKVLKSYLFNGNVFENNDSNYYHPKPQTNPETWCVNEKLLNNSGVLYIIRKVFKRRL